LGHESHRLIGQIQACAPLRLRRAH